MSAQRANGRADDGRREEIQRWIITADDMLGLPDKLAVLGRHWHAVRTGEAVPARTAIDPSALMRILPQILIFGLERVDGQVSAVRIRLMGTTLVNIYDRDWTGLTTRDFDREDRVADHLARMQEIAARGCPLYWRHWSLAKGCEDLFAEHLFCPLTDASGEVSRVISVLDFPGMENDPRLRSGFSPMLIRHG